MLNSNDEVNYNLTPAERKEVYDKLFLGERFSPEFIRQYFDFLANIRREAARLGVELASVIDPENTEAVEDNSFKDDIEVLKYFDHVLRFEHWDGDADDPLDDQEEDPSENWKNFEDEREP